MALFLAWPESKHLNLSIKSKIALFKDRIKKL